jgi:hypothetical protein
MFVRRLASLKPCAILFAILLAGCGYDGFGIAEARFEGTYALEAVNGRTRLPVTTYRAGGEEFIMLADTLKLRADGTLERTQVIRVVLDTQWEQSDNVIRRVYDQAYRIDRRELTVGFFDPCPDNAMCIGPDVGTISSSAISLVVQFPGQPTMRYGRIR